MLATVDDRCLPAAVHLTSDAAADVLAAALAYEGNSLTSWRVSEVHYRPGHDLIVRYRTSFLDRDGRVSEETMLAATSSGGAPIGTLPLIAGDGDALQVGVWRWPFDPLLTGLREVVTPNLAERALGGIVSGPLRIEVVAYRPADRAVVRVATPGRTLFVKVVDPARAAALADRHVRLRDAGVPAPRVLACDEERGWIVMEELAGDTLRERIKSSREPWPSAGEWCELADRFGGADLDPHPPVRRRLADVAHHGGLLATLLPDLAGRLEHLVDVLDAAAASDPSVVDGAVHGDLHEAQVVLGGGDRIAGILDVDDAGPGDPIDDHANLLAHLAHRALTDEELRRPVGDYAAQLRVAFAHRHDAARLDVATAASLIGLASGPFRVQRPGWREAALAHVAEAERLINTR